MLSQWKKLNCCGCSGASSELLQRCVCSSQACIFDCLLQCPHTSLLICFQCVWSSMDVMWNHVHKEMCAHKMSLVYKSEVWGLLLLTNVNVSSSSFHPEQAALWFITSHPLSSFQSREKIFLFWWPWVLFLPLPDSAVQSFQRTDSLKYHMQWWVHRWLWGHPTSSVYLLVQHYTNQDQIYLVDFTWHYIALFKGATTFSWASDKPFERMGYCIFRLNVSSRKRAFTLHSF